MTPELTQAAADFDPFDDSTADARFRMNVRDVVAGLTDLHKRALDELDGFYGRGPRHLSAALGITEKQAREILQHFRREGIVDYGSLFEEDSGLCQGRGYWLDVFGRAVKAAALGEQ